MILGKRYLVVTGHQRRTGSSNRPWIIRLDGHSSIGVSRNSGAPANNLSDYSPPKGPWVPSIQLPPLTFDVAAHLPGGPTGPPNNCQVDRWPSPPLLVRNCFTINLACFYIFLRFRIISKLFNAEYIVMRSFGDIFAPIKFMMVMMTIMMT